VARGFTKGGTKTGYEPTGMSKRTSRSQDGEWTSPPDTCPKGIKREWKRGRLKVNPVTRENKMGIIGVTGGGRKNCKEKKDMTQRQEVLEKLKWLKGLN